MSREIERAHGPGATAPEPGPARVLLVDDDRGILELLQLHLAAVPYAVTLAQSGEEALAAVSGRRFEVAIVDLRLGEEDGIEVMERLQARQPGLEVIIATAHATIESAVAATKRGAFDYVTKPFAAGEFLHRVARAVEAGGYGMRSRSCARWCRGAMSLTTL
jgi:DNA-binding NtrC family response regulator